LDFLSIKHDHIIANHSINFSLAVLIWIHLILFINFPLKRNYSGFFVAAIDVVFISYVFFIADSCSLDHFLAK
jgi:hypothetical protein